MSDLFSQYGYCIIPKDTLLYRGHADNSHQDVMFFATRFSSANGFNNNVQVWKVTVDIQLLFLVDYLGSNNWVISSLPNIYNLIFPLESDERFTDLDIKHRDINKRNALISALYNNHEISGWFTSIEGRIELEVCLFNKEANAKQLVLIDICNQKGSYFENSIDNFLFYPSDIFYQKTKGKLNPKSDYKRYIKACVKHNMETLDMSKDEAKHSMLDLRSKLKI